MIILPILVAGGTLYAGGKLIKQIKNRRGSAAQKKYPHRRQPLATATVIEVRSNPAILKAKQNLALSSTSLGLATTGALAHLPMVSVASWPAILYVFAPTFREAWRTLYLERRVDVQVLDATRITVCVAMGYTFIAAINAVFYALSQRLFARSEADFQRQLQECFGKPSPGLWQYCEGAELRVNSGKLDDRTVIVFSTDDWVPVETQVLYGEAWVNQYLDDGQTSPVKKVIGQRIPAMSRIVAGKIYVRLMAHPEESNTLTTHKILTHAAQTKGMLQKIGEQNGERMAPWMLGSFLVTLPLMGASRAAAFLTTTFGAHMQRLSPHTQRQFIGFAAQHGIVIKQPRALERANLITTMIIDSRLLQQPAIRVQVGEVIQSLRQCTWINATASTQRFAVHVFVTSAEEKIAKTLLADLGLDDYFVEDTSAGRASIIERLQMSGRIVCYLGTGEQDQAEMRTAMLAIAHGNLSLLSTTPAQILLLNNNLSHLRAFFDLAMAFTARQAGNLLIPIGCDLIDISTTLFLDFGLIYSLMFTYFGLFLSATYSRLPDGEVVGVQETPLALLASR